MQYLPSDVLQGAQQQGEERHSSGDRESGEAMEGGRRGSLQRVTPPSSPPPLSLTPPHSPRASSPPPPTSLDLTSASPSESAWEAPRSSRDGLDRRRSSLGEDARLRSGHRPRAPPTPPRPRTSEAVPSQLLGGRSEADADVLSKDKSMRAGSSSSDLPFATTVEYHNASYEATAARLRNLLSPEWPQRNESGFSRERPVRARDSPPETPSSSMSAETKRTIGSSGSNASSFAFFVSNTRSDKRLFKPRSQPLAHLSKQTPLSRRPLEKRRDSSYYKPKVVEDSAVAKSITPRNLRGSMSLSMADFIKGGKLGPVKQPVPSTPLRSHVNSSSHASSLHSSRASRSVSPAPQKSVQQATPRKSVLLRASTGKSLIQPPPMPSKCTPSRSVMNSSSVRESRGRIKKQASPPTALHSIPDSPHMQGHHHRVTPPEADPSSPTHHRFVHGDHYFRTFGSDTMHARDSTLTLISPQRPSPASNSTPKVSWRLPRGSDKSNNRAVERRKRSSIFRFGRKPAILEGDPEMPDSKLTNVRPALAKDTPNISITTPADAEPRGRSPITSSSEYTLPHYFAQPRRRDHSSTGSSPARSPGAYASLRPRGAHRRLTSSDESSQLSPFTSPHRPRLHQTRTLESIIDADPTPAAFPVVSQSDVKQDLGHSQKNSSKRSSPRLSSVLHLGSVSKEAGMAFEEQFMPSTTPKRAETAKRVGFDSREPQAESPSSSLREMANADGKRVLSLASISSLSSIFRAMTPKPTQNKLKRKSSQATTTSMASSNLPPLTPRHNLEVTGF